MKHQLGALAALALVVTACSAEEEPEPQATTSWCVTALDTAEELVLLMEDRHDHAGRALQGVEHNNQLHAEYHFDQVLELNPQIEAVVQEYKGAASQCVDRD